MDTLTRVGHQSWCSRLCNALVGMLFGFIFIVGGLHLLVWNEGNSVEAHKSLEEGLKAVVRLSTADEIDGEHQDQLVHVTGLAATETTLTDALFDVTPSDPVLKLQRKVEMYQWAESSHTETKKNTGGSTTTETTYSYTTEWADHAINSNGFELSEDHENPAMPFGAWSQTASPIQLGQAFTLSNVILSQMNWFEPMHAVYSVEDVPESTTDGATISPYLDLGYYMTRSTGSPGSPAVGDLRITYESVPSQTISVIAQQHDSTFTSYVTSNQRTIALVEAGSVTADEMFLHANQAVTAMAWFLRLGFLVIWLGLQMIIKPVSVFADVLPCVGNLVEGISCLITGIVALGVSAIVIAIAWIAYRPFLSLGLLALAGGAGYYCYQKRGHQAPPRGAVPIVAAYPVDDAEEDLELQVRYEDTPKTLT